MVRKDYERIFSHLEPPEPPEGLFDKIMARIRGERQLLAARKQFFLLSAVALASAGAFIPAIGVFRKEFAQSGLFQYLSLAFSDVGTAAANWQDFSLALLESLPAASLATLLAALFVLLWSFKHLAQNAAAVLSLQLAGER